MNPVGVDAVVQQTAVRCVAGGYVWNPYYTQLADPLNVSHFTVFKSFHTVGFGLPFVFFKLNRPVCMKENVDRIILCDAMLEMSLSVPALLVCLSAEILNKIGIF